MSLFDDLPDPVSESADSMLLQPRKRTSSTNSDFSEVTSHESKHEVVVKMARRQECTYEEAGETILLKTCATVTARRGERPSMQDAHVIQEHLDSKISDVHRLSFYAVYDGHSGTAASQYAAQHLHSILLKRLAGAASMEVVLKDAKHFFAETYRRVDEDFLKVASATRPPLKDGSTATTVLLINNVLLVANVGDSRAVLYRAATDADLPPAQDQTECEDLKPLLLTSDHKPAQYSERQRIQRAGGQVIDGRVSGIIEVSRSLGDAAFKRLGVTCLPDLRRCELNRARDRALVLACDGLWNCFNVEQVGHEIAAARLHQAGISAVERRTRQEQVCARLAGEAVRRLSGDNVTVMLVTFE